MASYRTYKTLQGNAYASVTTIIQETADYRTRMHLENWLKVEGNESKAQTARERGELYDSLLQKHIKGQPYFVPSEYEEGWNCLLSTFAGVNQVLWANEAMIPELTQFKLERTTIGKSSMNEVVLTPSFWSDEHGYAGCPDLICKMHGQTVLLDLKTSDCFYRKMKPPFDPQRGDEWRLQTKGWHKFHRTALQLTAYKLAIEEQTNLKIDAMAALVLKVSEPIACCFYTVPKEEEAKFLVEWLNKVKSFNQKKNGKNKGSTHKVVNDRQNSRSVVA